MRCARCARDWADTTLAPNDLEPAAAVLAIGSPDPAATEPPSLDSSVPPAHPALAANAGVRFGWAGSALLVALGAWSVIAWRQDVMHAWPPSGRLYAALGLTVGR